VAQEKRQKKGISMVSDGDMAPDFTLPTDDGHSLSLSGLRGHPVVLFFYPKDDTSGCTAEAKDFSCLSAEFERAGAVVIGVSPDSVKSHQKFKSKYDLAVRLVADEEKAAALAYGVWAEKSLYGRKYMGVDRSTFLIDGAGKVLKSWRKVKVPGHAEAVLAEVRAVKG
jgi:thioredoxin-dependent peroxiredoxin